MTASEIAKVQSDLNRMTQGRILDPGDPGYADAITIDNNRVSLQPYLVVLPANADDVATIVKYCHQHGVPLTTKAGGHSATGYCLNAEGVVMDLGDMNSVDFVKGDTSRITVGTGTRWIKAYNFLRDRQSPLTVIGGGCAGVGVAGFVLGGGYSFISRSYGLGCDSVTGMEFITADGNKLELNDSSSGDEAALYRALRGGGGGNFGVVTRIDLQLHKTNERRMMMGQIDFPFYQIKDILRFYNQWVLTLPDEMAVYGMLRNFPDPRFGGKPALTLRFTPIYNGKFSDGMALLEPLTKIAKRTVKSEILPPKSVELYTMSLPEWENFVGTSTQIKGHSAYIRSSILPPESLTDDVADICMENLSRAPSPDSYVVWTHTGGKIRKNGEKGKNGKMPVKSVYAHRDGLFTFELKSVWASAQPLQARPNIEWAVKFYDELGEHAQGAYLNYIDPLLLDWKKSYYRHEYEGLLKVRERWDPKGLFHFQQCIGSEYETARREKGKPLDLSPLTRTLIDVKKNGGNRG